MCYAKVKEVSHAEAVKIIHAVLQSRHLNLHDLANMIQYTFFSKGLLELESFFKNDDITSETSGWIRHKNTVRENLVRRKIGEALGIDHELLLGERKFENREELCRFVFNPYLVRIPSNTIPSQITIFGFVGFKRAFVVGSYPELLNRPVDEQLEFIKDIAIADTKERESVIFFGKKLGYAYYYDYEKPAIPISLHGELMKGMEIGYGGDLSCSVTASAKVIAETGHFRIPRLVPKEANSEI